MSRRDKVEKQGEAGMMVEEVGRGPDSPRRGGARSGIRGWHLRPGYRPRPRPRCLNLNHLGGGLMDRF